MSSTCKHSTERKRMINNKDLEPIILIPRIIVDGNEISPTLNKSASNSKLTNTDKTPVCAKRTDYSQSIPGIISEKEKEIKDREKMMGIKYNTIQSLEKVIKLKESYIKNLQSQLKTTEQRSSKLQAESVELQQKYMASEENVYALKVKNVDLMKSIKEDKVKANFQSQLKKTEHKSSELKNESVKLQQKFKAFEDQISALEKKNVELKTSFQAEKYRSNVKTSSTQQSSEISKKTLQEKKDLELRCLKLSKQVSEFKKIIITERDTFVKERKVLEDKNSEFPKQIFILQDLLEKERKAFQENKKSLEIEKKKYEKRNVGIFNEISDKTKNLQKDFELERSHFESEISKLTSKITVLSSDVQ
ncbi:hypothetical protein L6452_18358 [Arctium lappa]|uniref:Uncharacterized protein n=1 Tax=Arctium lappa TaxID=4217 RepID=A0ACB9C669_ARCLA|nr:hypothetical protein L6452_18358 [Arctium lappa]